MKRAKILKSAIYSDAFSTTMGFSVRFLSFWFKYRNDDKINNKMPGSRLFRVLLLDQQGRARGAVTV
jgi:hypothetical protein